MFCLFFFSSWELRGRGVWGRVCGRWTLAGGGGDLKGWTRATNHPQVQVAYDASLALDHKFPTSRHPLHAGSRRQSQSHLRERLISPCMRFVLGRPSCWLAAE
ncbi:hypothetical protein DFH06DRAFT_1181368 [Mycena polygramma]|nr:hypothetical protein DFH06DRAFT_1181368 [Mycena polygramma]